MPNYVIESQEDVLTLNGKRVLGKRATGPYKHIFLYMLEIPLSPEEIMTAWTSSVFGVAAAARLSPTGREPWWICVSGAARGPGGERSVLDLPRRRRR